MTELENVKDYPLYVAGKAVSTGQWLEVQNKYQQTVFARVAVADDKVLEKAIVASVKAEVEMAALNPYQKQKILLHCVKRFNELRDELTEILIAEGGKPRNAASAEVERLINTFQLAADAVTQIDEGRVLPLAVTPAAARYRGMVKQVPIGAVSLISPFNFPLNLVAHKIAPAIAAGCPFVLKPASLTPISALKIAEVLAEMDLPKGAWSILPCERQAADILVTDDRFKLLSFTGSDQVGWDMKARAGRKRVTLELGGNAAVLIDADTVVDDALIDRLIGAAYGHAGQICISVQRILIHADIYAEVKKKLLAKLKKIKADDPTLSTTLVGPMIKSAEATRLKKWIDKAEKKGAKILIGGNLHGVLLEPTLLENVDAKLEIYKDEAFGPVAILEKFKNFEQGIATINQSRFGLQAGVYTQSLNHMLYAWDHLHVGGVIINDVPTFRVDNMPYGGVKDSGLGREGIHAAIRDMQEERLLVIKEIS
ncbi:aldehyde dehydrogenase family protein [Acinetobacter haemolyticus]|uniref:aldehyde dehydrogenase family protein n=1 Tax=Acinetobacter haemolyticus TaxID=29430 RepID=UPI00137333F6|nr:aldehyde dehydrogenase family protein [Acinetobacter haemolyticus]NAR17627.1 aldehyde dehydrogenase family protein [Acinetobacter haemolyticus]NAR29600.1 aldehyde dehydrogenase family protein [Acinetobacter haemolyticus]NAR35941.1 aldehyde dehydrogenase family protein [Acinetobacter haemolyticus]NAR47859.1 aldehyde dehydrogenase family protein [Acinetobacter haemolyticus]NAR65174.1 aldehyde dehydrogenase family protein [Acinetobacter haemolyticus]